MYSFVKNVRLSKKVMKLLIMVALVRIEPSYAIGENKMVNQVTKKFELLKIAMTCDYY